MKLSTIIILLIIGWLCCSNNANANPIVINRGGTYTFDQTFSESPGIIVNTTEPVTFRYCAFVTYGQKLFQCVPGANLTFEFDYLGSQVVGGVLLNPWKPSKLIVRNCHFEGGGSSGIIVEGDGSSTQAIIDIEASDFHDCYIAEQLNGICNDPNIFVAFNRATGDAYTLRTDQFSTYNSSGTPYSYLTMRDNFVEGCPDAPQTQFSAGITGGDGYPGHYSKYTEVIGNVILNGQGNGISMEYPGQGNVSKCVDNIVVGIGYKPYFSFGISWAADSGYYVGNTVCWWNTQSSAMTDYLESSGGGAVPSVGNLALPGSLLSLEYEQNLYWLWTEKMVSQGISVGYGPAPEVTYPQPSDFPQ
jgi:hypothetical protein